MWAGRRTGYGWTGSSSDPLETVGDRPPCLLEPLAGGTDFFEVDNDTLQGGRVDKFALDRLPVKQCGDDLPGQPDCCINVRQI